MPDPRLRLELIDCDYKPFEYTALNTSLYVNINEIHHTGTLNDISQNVLKIRLRHQLQDQIRSKL